MVMRGAERVDAFDGRVHTDEDDGVRARSELTPRKEDGAKAVIVQVEMKSRMWSDLWAEAEALKIRGVWWEEHLRLKASPSGPIAQIHKVISRYTPADLCKLYYRQNDKIVTTRNYNCNLIIFRKYVRQDSLFHASQHRRMASQCHRSLISYDSFKVEHRNSASLLRAYEFSD